MSKQSLPLRGNITIFDNTGKKSGTASLSKEMAQEGSIQVLSQAIHIYRDRRHPGNKDTKTRAEVNITKKKIYKQKGTGGARHGAASAPIFVGGGVTFGPKPVKRVLVLPQNMRKKALQVALFQKTGEGRLVGVEGLSQMTKTKDAAKVVSEVQKALSLKSDSKTLLVYQNDGISYKAFRNLPRVVALPMKNLNAYEVFIAGAVILDASFAQKEAKKVAVKKTIKITKTK